MDRRILMGDRPAHVLSATLHHIALSTPDPSGLAQFYRRALGYEPFMAGDILGVRAQDRTLLFVPGQAKCLAAAGFTLADLEELERLQQRIMAAGAAFERAATLLFDDAISVMDPDGNRYVFGLSEDQSPSFSQDLARSPARLQHVVIASQAPEAIVAFFVNVLGFTVSDIVVDDQGGIRTSFLRCSQEHHSFAVFQAKENRLDHHCYEARDWNAIRDWADHLAEERIPLKWGPGRHGPGNNLFLFVHDPDGNWVELSAELEIVEHDRPLGVWPHEERTLNSWGQGLLRS